MCLWISASGKERIPVGCPGATSEANTAPRRSSQTLYLSSRLDGEISKYLRPGTHVKQGLAGIEYSGGWI